MTDYCLVGPGRRVNVINEKAKPSFIYCSLSLRSTRPMLHAENEIAALDRQRHAQHHGFVIKDFALKAIKPLITFLCQVYLVVSCRNSMKVAKLFYTTETIANRRVQCLSRIRVHQL